MTTAIDRNGVIALWDADPALSSMAQNALETSFRWGNLVVAAPVLAELVAGPAGMRLRTTYRLIPTQGRTCARNPLTASTASISAATSIASQRTAL